MKKLFLTLLMLLLARTEVAFAADQPNLEAGLIKALKIKRGTNGRLGDSGVAIQAYIQAGYLDLKPTQRADYTDFRLLKKPTTFMGHTLVLIEEEYMARHVGCCVSPGAGVIVRLVGSSKKLEKFADENSCSFNLENDPQSGLKTYGVNISLPRGKYVLLSCRERDANNAQDARDKE